MEKATLAGGCFWCTEAIFKRLKGVSSVLPGYSGGNVKIQLMNKFVLEQKEEAIKFGKEVKEEYKDT